MCKSTKVTSVAIASAPNESPRHRQTDTVFAECGGTSASQDGPPPATKSPSSNTKPRTKKRRYGEELLCSSLRGTRVCVGGRRSVPGRHSEERRWRRRISSMLPIPLAATSAWRIRIWRLAAAGGPGQRPSTARINSGTPRAPWRHRLPVRRPAPVPIVPPLHAAGSSPCRDE